jgi:1-acyl-sn-glycerol-3-phosphate acyltransferase
MAEIKPQVYKDPRPAEYFTRFHQRARTREPDGVYGLVRIVLTPPTLLAFRAWAIGTENVPRSGPVILAPNHFSNWDHFFAAVYLRRRVQFMGKSQLFGANPAITFIISHGGVFPVRRGHQDEEAFLTANGILEREGAIVMYCEGGRSRTGTLSELPKRGIGRLALESGATVVPVAIHGSSHVRNWKRGQFPKVRVRYGDAIRWPRVPDPTRDQQQAAANEIFARIRTLYATLER